MVSTRRPCYDRAPMATSFAPAWLSADPLATALLPDRFRHAAQRAQAAASAAARRIDPTLVQALTLANARLPPCPVRERHLANLAQPGTIAVVTGQQVGLFLGPLFSVYKAASAIALARTLAAETGRLCVPIFWLQTEDHDFPEIDHCLVPRASGEPLRVALDDAEGGASRIPVGHRKLGPSVLTALDAIEKELTNQDHTPELMALLRRAYRPEATLADAFTSVLAEVLADSGLIFLDPRDPAVSRLAAPVHRRCLQEATALADALAARGRELEAAGFSQQVHIRPGSPLFFFAPDAADGPRYRLDPAQTPEVWTLVGHPHGATVTTAELLAWLDREPLRFTGSALSRPLVQDTLLPTMAYVGGPGEIAYFAQLGPAYEQIGLPMPLVLHRARFRVLDDRTREQLARIGLSADEVALPPEVLLPRLAARAAGDGFAPPDEVAARLTAGIDAELAALAARMAELDPNLAKAVARTRDAVHEATARLIDKYSRALAQRDQVALDRLARLRAWLAPGGVPQERVHGLPYFAARLGVRAFGRLVLTACAPATVLFEEAGRMQELKP